MTFFKRGGEPFPGKHIYGTLAVTENNSGRLKTINITRTHRGGARQVKYAKRTKLSLWAYF